MELRQYIEATAKTMIPLIDHIQLVDYKDGEYYFRLPTGELFKTKGLK